MAFRVTLVACVAGDPRKAWNGTSGPDDEVHVPDDEWESQEYSFDDLEEAKSFVSKLNDAVTTHVELSYDNGGEWAVIYRKDEGDGTLEDAHVPTDDEIAAEERAAAAALPLEPLPLLPRQGTPVVLEG